MGCSSEHHLCGTKPVPDRRGGLGCWNQCPQCCSQVWAPFLLMVLGLALEVSWVVSSSSFSIIISATHWWSALPKQSSSWHHSPLWLHPVALYSMSSTPSSARWHDWGSLFLHQRDVKLSISDREFTILFSQSSRKRCVKPESWSLSVFGCTP